jgi:hypothetical protein
MKQDATTPETSHRSQERQALAAAIRARNEAEARESTLTKAAERARADAFLARRAVEAAEAALNRARETARASLVDAYVGDGDSDDSRAAPSDVIEAEATLAAAQRRLSDLQLVEKELSVRTGPAPGRSLPGMRVDEAVREVVRSHPTLRRLVQDFRLAERTFRTTEATLIWLAGQKCIPADLTEAGPKAHHTRYAEPDPAWLAAVESLKRDADAALPES